MQLLEFKSPSNCIWIEVLFVCSSFKKCKQLNSEILLNLDFFLVIAIPPVPFPRPRTVREAYGIGYALFYCHSAGWLWYLYSKKKHFHYCLHHVLLLSLTTFPFSLFGGRYLLSVPFMQSIINHAGRSRWILGSLISEALCKKKRTAFSAVDVNITWAEKDRLYSMGYS